jgi:iron complex transport system substrate-binding protein
VAFKEGWAEISLEALPEYLGEADHIFLGIRGESAGAQNYEERKKEIMSLNVWKDLPAVKAGNVHLYDVQTLYFQDIIALENQADFILESLLSTNK